MIALVFLILGVVGLGALAMAFVPSLAGSNRADKRMKALQGDIQAYRRNAEVSRSREDRRKQLQQTLRVQNDALGKARRRVPLQDQIYQAGMKIKARAWVRTLLILGIVFTFN